MMSFAAASYSVASMTESTNNCVQYSDTENATFTVLVVLNIVATSECFCEA